MSSIGTGYQSRCRLCGKRIKGARYDVCKACRGEPQPKPQPHVPNPTWFANLDKLVAAQYAVYIMADHPRSFATWCEAKEQVRRMLWNSNCPIETVVHSFFRLVEFKGTANGHPFSINVPFPTAF